MTTSAAAVEPGQLGGEGGGAVEVVEGEDLLHPARSGQPFGLLGDEAGAGGDDEHVVVERRAVGQVHLLGVDVDVVDGRLVVVDAGVQLLAAGADDVLGVGQAERHEQQTRLVDVAVVLVDDGDRDVGQLLAEPVRRQRAARTRSQDDNPCIHGSSFGRRRPEVTVGSRERP